MQNLALSLFIMISLLFGSFAFGQGQSFTIDGCSITNYISDRKTSPLGWTNTLMHQNEVKPAQTPIISFNISCPGNIRIETTPYFNPIELEKVNLFWSEVKPIQATSPYKVTISPMNNTTGPTVVAEYDNMNRYISVPAIDEFYKGTTSTTAKIRVVMEIRPHYFISDFYKPRYYWSGVTNETIKIYNHHSRLIASPSSRPYLEVSSMPCKANTYETAISPAVIDFGSLSKQELEGGSVVHRSFNLLLQKKEQGGNCNLTLSPKVTFTPLDNYENNSIYLN